MYLLDTVILSELRKRDRDPGVVRWIEERRQDELFVSVISLGEVERGIAKQKRIDAVFASRLTAWLERTTTLYGERILPVTVSVARLWGRLTFELGRNDADVLIAATALDYGLAVATRNVKHFEAIGVSIVNPFGPPDTPPVASDR